jgi:hypothetical protein
VITCTGFALHWCSDAFVQSSQPSTAFLWCKYLRVKMTATSYVGLGDFKKSDKHIWKLKLLNVIRCINLYKLYICLFDLYDGRCVTHCIIWMCNALGRVFEDCVARRSMDSSQIDVKVMTVNLPKITVECNAIYSWCTDISVTWCLSLEGMMKEVVDFAEIAIHVYGTVLHGITPQNAQVFGNTTEILKSWPHSA